MPAGHKARIMSAIGRFEGRHNSLSVEDQRLVERDAGRELERSGGHPASGVPSEWKEQRLVCQWLDAKRLVYFSVPNRLVDGSTEAGRRRGHLSKLIGAAAGVPDLIIVTPSPKTGMPVALEMKRSDQTEKALSPNQKEWREKFRAARWSWICGYGADDAMQKLEGLYG